MSTTKPNYSELLRDPRWQKLRLEILEAANWKCEDCGNPDDNLQVHHCIYIKGRDPWDYTRSTLICVCDGCHEKRQELEQEHKLQSAKLLRFSTPEQISKWAERLSSIVAKIPRHKA